MLIKTYFCEDEWETTTEMFMGMFQHRRDPETLHETLDEYINRDTTKDRIYVSDIYLTYVKRMSDANWFVIKTKNTKIAWQPRINTPTGAEQTFAVLFALWWGLSQAQVAWIADEANKDTCWNWLDYFLCNPNALPTELPDEELYCIHYNGQYHKLIPETGEGGIR